VGLFSSIFRRTPRTPALITGRVLTAQQVGDFVGFPVILKDATYAEVSSAWLRSFYDDFRAVLFREGVTKWEETFDCDDFAAFYVSLAAVRFFNATWSSPIKAEALAIGEYWYRPEGGKGAGHTIVTALTERGQIYIEPQSGKEVYPTAAEKLSRYLVKF
jgi:hypothetical protein